MGGSRGASVRWVLWPVLGAAWLGLAGATVFSEDDGQPHASSAEARDESKPAEVEAPSESDRLTPPRGIRPPWREPLIPEQRGPERKRRPLPA